MEEIENHEETIKRICAEHFSRETQEAIEHLAIDLSCIHETVGTVATEVLRKAVESWKNVPLSNGESDMRTLIRYVNEAVQGREIKTLELKYLAKEIERIKREIPERLTNAFVLRLSPEVQRRVREIELGLDKGSKTRVRVRIKATKEELTELLSMPPGQFAEFERDVFLPKLREISQQRMAKYGLTTPSASRGVVARQQETSTGSPKKGDKPRTTATATGIAIIRVAPIKYTEKNFREVDRLIRKNYKKIEAYKEVFQRHFSEEKGDSLYGFKKAYEKYQRLSRRTKGIHL